ncbi:MAG: HAMP domain-containing protein [Alphaproteobacteria bacterium]|nr:MAG: HAMP domain-containing protein [Alphaproteobacteria bacterium]
MEMQWLRRGLPRGLFNRALLILLLPILLLQAVIAVVFIQRHFDGVTRQMTEAVAYEILYAVETVENAASLSDAARQLEMLAVPLGLFLTLDPDTPITPGLKLGFWDLSGRALADELARRIARPMAIDLMRDDKVVFLHVATARGALLAEIPRRRMVAANPHLLLVWMLGSSAVLSAIAIAFLRNQIRPIRDLARAAEAFGKGRTLPFRPRGAAEVRAAGAAFLAMRARIERQIEQRTRMLTGVSHDLRTPLTRIRLALAMMEPGPETEEIASDIAEMERMLDAFLAFARGDGQDEPAPVDPASLAARIVADAARMGREVELRIEGGPPGPVALRPATTRRAVQNLIDNALAHGRRVRLTLRLSPQALAFVVEDDGPGIPPERRAEALRPFVRLDEARNQDRGGGVGLGLAIALDAARAQGGGLTLDDSADLGGLRATLTLPR